MTDNIRPKVPSSQADGAETRFRQPGADAADLTTPEAIFFARNRRRTSADLVDMNFKVPRALRHLVKMLAANWSLTMTSLLKLAIEAFVEFYGEFPATELEAGGRTSEEAKGLMGKQLRGQRALRLRLPGPNGARDEFDVAAAAQNLGKLAKRVPMPA